MFGFENGSGSSGRGGKRSRGSSSNVRSINSGRNTKIVKEGKTSSGSSSGSSRRSSSNTSNKGFASMDDDKQRRIAVKGGRASHTGAPGNSNASGSHNIPPSSMAKIKEGGRKGGANSHSGGRPSGSSTKLSRSTKSGMSSRASGSGMNSSRRGNSQSTQNDSNVTGISTLNDRIQEAKQLADRLDDVLNELAG